MDNKMKKALLLFLLIALPLMAGDSKKESAWLTSLEAAKEQLADSDKTILLYFSGSDWCRPCIQLKKRVLESDSFKEFADQNLAMVLLDFPAKKKNKLSDEQRAYNEKMAERFNEKGAFPLVVLLNGDEKVLTTFSGYREESPEDYIANIKEAIK